MSKLNKFNDSEDKEADNIYYNIRITNTGQTGFSTLGSYDVTKNDPIVKKCSDFYLSVVDFSLNVSNIPIFIAQVQYNPLSVTDVNYTVYFVSITVGGIEYAQNVSYVPHTNFTPPPPPQPTTPMNGRPFTTDRYYYIYSYSSFLEMINNALAAAYIAAGNPGGAGAPYFEFTQSEYGLISLIVPNAFIAAGATIEFNSELLQYLEGFETTYIFPLQKFRFVFYQRGNICNVNGAEVGIVGGTSWIYKQQFYCLQLWNTMRKIYFATSSIPINSEYKTTNVRNTDTPNSVTTLSPIILDYIPKFDILNSSRTIIFYNSCEYRLVDTLSDSPLYHIQVSVFWQDVYGNSFPLYIGINDEITIKLAFFKKSLYKNYYPRLLK